jgi:hypothetical protein
VCAQIIMSRVKLQGRAARLARMGAHAPAHLFVYAATHIVSSRPAGSGARRGGGVRVAGKQRHLQRFRAGAVSLDLWHSPCYREYRVVNTQVNDDPIEKPASEGESAGGLLLLCSRHPGDARLLSGAGCLIVVGQLKSKQWDASAGRQFNFAAIQLPHPTRNQPYTRC